MMLSEAQLKAIMPRANAGLFLSALNSCMVDSYIDTWRRRAMFLANVAHESAELARMSENLNYSAERLLEVFPKYFDFELAQEYGRKPQRIGSRVYANRFGNGDESSGDGYRYRARGPLGLTFKSNYLAAGTAIGVDLVKEPDLVAQPDIGCEVAGWYWLSHGCNELADDHDFDGVVKAINGGLNGLADRRAYFARALAILPT